MNKPAIHCLREITPCLVLLILLPALGLAGCKAQAPPLSPGAAAFKKDVRDILARLTPALAGPLAQNDAKAAEQVILSLYPTAGQEQADFPFRLGALSKEGVLLAALPPVQAIGDDFIKYQGVQEILANRRLNKKRLYAPDGAPVYFDSRPRHGSRQDRRAGGLAGDRRPGAQEVGHHRAGMGRSDRIVSAPCCVGSPAI